MTNEWLESYITQQVRKAMAEYFQGDELADETETEARYRLPGTKQMLDYITETYGIYTEQAELMLDRAMDDDNVVETIMNCIKEMVSIGQGKNCEITFLPLYAAKKR